MKQLQRHVMKILIIQAHNSVKIFEATTCSFQTIVPLSIQMTPTLINTVSLSTQTLSPGMNLKSTRKSQTQLRHKQWLVMFSINAYYCSHCSINWNHSEL